MNLTQDIIDSYFSSKANACNENFVCILLVIIDSTFYDHGENEKQLLASLNLYYETPNKTPQGVHTGYISVNTSDTYN